MRGLPASAPGFRPEARSPKPGVCSCFLLRARFALRGVEQRAAGVEVQRVAELVRLGRSGRFDAGRLLAGVVAAVAALAERAEEIPQRAVAEEIERLVGDRELCRRLDVVPMAPAGAAALPLGARGVEIRRHRDVALVRHALDDLLDQFFELRPGIALIGVGRIAEQPLDRFFRQDAAVEQRIEDGVVQRLHRPLFLVHAVRAAESAGQQKIRQLRDQILEIQIVELVADVFGVPVLHRAVVRGLRLKASGSGLEP